MTLEADLDAADAPVRALFERIAGPAAAAVAGPAGDRGGPRGVRGGPRLPRSLDRPARRPQRRPPDPRSRRADRG